MQIAAFFARVPYRIHGEHGRDIHDLHGKNTKYRVIKKILSGLVQYVVAVSDELENYLKYEVKVSTKKVYKINNGVDVNLFKPKNINESEFITHS